MKRTTVHRAFTLIELIASMVVLGVIASVSAPLIANASDAFVKAADSRDVAENLSHAMDRCVHLLRSAPATEAGSGLPDIVVAGSDDIEFADGSELQLVGSTLLLTPAGGAPATLCAGVTGFGLTYLGEDGATDSAAAPQSTQRIVVHIASGDQELRCVVFLRLAIGSPAS
ncbi:MAG: type II secretion system protein [Phycisphaeraceae bacterium]|nr:type II secretion system protein [Phycisphaeraceae bacterium]